MFMLNIRKANEYFQKLIKKKPKNLNNVNVLCWLFCLYLFFKIFYREFSLES